MMKWKYNLESPAHRLETPTSRPTASAACPRTSWRRAGLWSASTVAAEVALDKPGGNTQWDKELNKWSTNHQLKQWSDLRITGSRKTLKHSPSGGGCSDLFSLQLCVQTSWFCICEIKNGQWPTRDVFSWVGFRTPYGIGRISILVNDCTYAPNSRIGHWSRSKYREPWQTHVRSDGLYNYSLYRLRPLWLAGPGAGANGLGTIFCHIRPVISNSWGAGGPKIGPLLPKRQNGLVKTMLQNCPKNPKWLIYMLSIIWGRLDMVKILERFDDFSGGMNPRQGISPQNQ